MRQKQKNPSIKQANIFSYTPTQPTCVVVTTRLLFYIATMRFLFSANTHAPFTQKRALPLPIFITNTHLAPEPLQRKNARKAFSIPLAREV